MSRPRTRVAKLPLDRLQLLQEVFGGSLHAFRTLSPGCSYAVFRRVWDEKEELPGVVTAVDQAFGVWTQGLIERVKSAA